jgi:hypothetical protein
MRRKDLASEEQRISRNELLSAGAEQLDPSKLYLFYAVRAATLVAWTSVLAAILPLLDRHVSDVQRKNGLLRMSRTDRPFCDDFIQTAIHFDAKEGCCKYSEKNAVNLDNISEFVTQKIRRKI